MWITSARDAMPDSAAALHTGRERGAHRSDRVTAWGDAINEPRDASTPVAAWLTDVGARVSGRSEPPTDRGAAITGFRGGRCEVGAGLDAHRIPATATRGPVTASWDAPTTMPSATTTFAARVTAGLSAGTDGLSPVTDGELPTRSVADALVEDRDRRFPHRARETRTRRQLRRSRTLYQSVGQRSTTPRMRWQGLEPRSRSADGR